MQEYLFEHFDSIVQKPGIDIVDGSTIDWVWFDELPGDEISSLSLQDYEEMKEEGMRKNAWKVDAEVAARIDDAPVHSEYIKCLVSAKPDDGLSFNQDLLKERWAKKEVPGASYIKENIDFIEAHYQKG